MTGEVKEGGKWYEEDCGYLSIPVFVRENCLIAVGKETSRPDYDYADQVTIKAYALQEGKEAKTVVYNMNQIEDTVVAVKKENGKVKIHVEAEKPCRIVLVNQLVTAVENAESKVEGNDTVITCDGTKEITCIC